MFNGLNCSLNRVTGSNLRLEIGFGHKRPGPICLTGPKCLERVAGVALDIAGLVPRFAWGETVPPPRGPTGDELKAAVSMSSMASHPAS